MLFHPSFRSRVYPCNVIEKGLHHCFSYVGFAWLLSLYCCDIFCEISLQNVIWQSRRPPIYKFATLFKITCLAKIYRTNSKGNLYCVNDYISIRMSMLMLILKPMPRCRCRCWDFQMALMATYIPIVEMYTQYFHPSTRCSKSTIKTLEPGK